MIKLLTVIGARPQIIKAAALSRVIREEYRDRVTEVILHTGQHYDDSMSEVFFRELGIPSPDHYLGIGSASHGVQTGQMMEGIEKKILEERPDGVILYGDTNSTLAGAIAAAKIHVPVMHIEAGLRSFNKSMPEEINRIVCDHVSTLLFSPTGTGIRNLRNEGIVHHVDGMLSPDRQGVYHSGDVMYDNTLHFRELALKQPGITGDLGLEKDRYLLATIHRPSNTDVSRNLKAILSALHEIAASRGIRVILPLHPRTREILRNDPSLNNFEEPSGAVSLIPPVSFLDMIRLEASAALILTDSGGVQKEAWFMKKPVVVLREQTEWVEIIEHGNGKLAGADPARIRQATLDYLDNPPASFPEIFGNGDAARNILEVITSARWL
jgi:UDP-GlcNAc3NAcA epimerase